MLRFRAIALAGALVLAAVVNVFFAPQLYSHRPPVFTGGDMVAIDEWSGQGYRLHPVWLRENLPQATFTHLRTTGMLQSSGTIGEIGLLWDQQIVELAGLNTDRNQYPLDLSDFTIRRQVDGFVKLTGSTRCRVTLDKRMPHRCNYFVAWDEDDFQPGHLTFIAVFTETNAERPEIGFIQESLLQRFVPHPIARAPNIGETKR